MTLTDDQMNDICKQYHSIGRGYKTHTQELQKAINKLKGVNSFFGSNFVYTNEVRTMMNKLQTVYHELETYRLKHFDEYGHQSDMYVKGFEYAFEELRSLQTIKEETTI